MTGHSIAATMRGLRTWLPSSVRLMTAREFFRSPAKVGSAFPAMPGLVRAALAPVDFSDARIVVEFGPGQGPFTRALLDRMPQDATLVTIDVSHRFTRFLQETIPDPRLEAVTGSAASVRSILERLGFGPVDHIVTGIPFSTIEPAIATRILDASAGALKQDGQIIAYQMRDTVAPMLAERFAAVSTGRVWSNIPPCRIYWARTPL